MDQADSDRLDRLEREIAILRAEFAKLREHIGAPKAAPPRAEYRTPPPPPPAPAPSAGVPPAPEAIYIAPEPRRSFEDIIGRYVSIAFGALLVLIGTGAFLTWAFRYLGPTARVILGYAGAAGLAFAGIRLRMRGTREFGNVLLAIALGVVHLVCWSAGPLLHVLPTWVALAIGFVASVLLAEFALRHDEQMLCAVGFGGAAIAPFVTSDGGGNRIALAIYGVAVVALGAAALGPRPWKFARGIAMWSVILYTATSGTGLPAASPPAWIAERLWVLTPVLMVVALIPFTHAEHRRSMIRVSAGALMLGAFLRADRWPADLPALLITLLGTIIIIGALDVTRPGALEREAPKAALDEQLIDRSSLLDAFLIPVGLFIATVAATPDVTSFQSAAVGIVFAAGALYMTHRTRGEPEGGRFAGSASLIALWIVPAAFIDQDLARAAGSAGMGILLLFTARRMNRLAFIAGALGSFTTASVFALLTVAVRPRFEYLPFISWASLGALIAVAGWITGTRLMSSAGFLPEIAPKVRASLREAFITGAGVTAFLWGVEELDGAWNRTAATSLLIVYYAATGALMIYFGRLRDVRHLRLIGLGVALWGAIKALIEAFGIPNVPVRVTVYFAVALFLIGIGYWYRRGAEPDRSVSQAPGV